MAAEMELDCCPPKPSISSVNTTNLPDQPVSNPTTTNPDPPPPPISLADEYYFGGTDRDVERQAIFASMFQQRCKLLSTHDV